MKHRILLTLALLMAVWAGVKADDVKYLVINYKSAQQPLVIALADEPVLTFSDNNLVVTEQKSGTVYTVALDEITSAPLVDAATGISAVRSATGGTIVAGHVVMQGLRPGAPAGVYTLGGSAVVTAKAGADGSLDIDLSGLQPGTYVVKTPAGAFKVARK